jgi:hypothetical protein
MSPDLRFALGRGSSHADWYGVPVRIDLQSGAIEQIGGVQTWFGSEVLRRQRYWRLIDTNTDAQEVLDLVTGERQQVGYDAAAQQIVLPAELHAAAEAEVRATARFRAPGNRHAWVLGDALYIEQPDGTVLQQPWPEECRRAMLHPVGHGIALEGGKQRQLYDLTLRQFVAPAGVKEPYGYAVRGIWLVCPQAYVSRPKWQRFDPASGALAPCAELQGCDVLGLFDDDHLLCSRRLRNGPRAQTWTDLFLYRPADAAITQLAVPEAMREPGWWIGCQSGAGSWMVVDPRQRVWLPCWKGGAEEQHGYVTIDPATLRVEQQPALLRGRAPGSRLWTQQILGFTDEHTVLASEGAQVVRIDTETGERVVLFPRPCGD